MEVLKMSMRSQVYEWDASRTDNGQTAAVTGTNAGSRMSVFIGGLGNNITKPAETTATEFVVIEDIAVSPALPIGISGLAGAVRGLTYAAASSGVAGGRAYVQVRINTTDYFLDPDNVPNDGIPGCGSPYPRSINFQPSFNLYPDVYVLPGQVWDVIVTFYNAEGLLFGGAPGTPAGVTAIDAGQLQAFTKYTLYDGPDALIANKLLEMGISINPGNVDWYKRSLLASQA
jgi:hypothetical protein